MKSSKRKYKIVVLTDLGKSSYKTLKSTVGLAKIIHGDIEVFYVKKPSDIVESDNQLSAMRTINDKHTKVDRQMKSLTGPISKEFGIDINYSFVFGNVKNEISDYIEKSRPDIVVLGKRKSKPFKLIGDSITEFILNVHDGVLMIASDKGCLVPNKEIAFGTLNSSEPSFNLEFAEELMEHTQKPLKSFKIIKNSASAKQLSKSTDKGTIEYVFEHNDSTVKNLSNYLSKNNINVLSIDRTKKDPDQIQNSMMPDITSMIGKLDVTLLVSGKQKYKTTY
ncbi:universal stress protein [Maribacter halichondriae]|uniref:universal stress protein n=1 Tax=Maribacter halichondriae TaxID=2980554 RepID=UPI002358E41B|nr:universal stress protein [Maribacter sp. Hal144]